MLAVDSLRRIETAGGNLYEHALRSATNAKLDAAPSTLVAAALLHDVGHAIEPEQDIDLEHAELGADWLASMFGPAVTTPIRLHVTAKRYLATRSKGTYDPGDASRLSLVKQGGALSAKECDAFERSPYFVDALRLRYYDDHPLIAADVTLDYLSKSLLKAAMNRSKRPKIDPRPIIYVVMTAIELNRDDMHFLQRAARYGRVVVGLLTDGAIAACRSTPFLNFDIRRSTLESLKAVHAIVPQETRSPQSNLERFYPKFMAYGNDLLSRYELESRGQAVDILRGWGGKIVTPSSDATLQCWQF